MDTLKYIIDTITKYTAIQYAEMMLDRERIANNKLHTFNVKTGSHKEQEVPYIEYMKGTWGYSGSDSIDECIWRSRVSKLNEYAKFISLYTGFIENGKVFVLNKKEKFVSFLCSVENRGQLQTLGMQKRTAVLFTHYNPLNVDCIEECVDKQYLFNGLETNDYEMSQNESWIISECDKLIKNT